MLREGDLGDGHVKIEDRLITASLRAYDGAEHEQVVSLFTAFAIFPEDVPIPRGLRYCDNWTLTVVSTKARQCGWMICARRNTPQGM